MKETSFKINYKLIEHERTEDAPFIGALISACGCNFNCVNCFNQAVKQLPTLTSCAASIIEEIKTNPFNKGIIFGGLEWTLQEKELLILAKLAKINGLKTMLYTGKNFVDIENLYKTKLFDYIKCGPYKEELKSNTHYEYGVKLASSNQHIYKGEDLR